MLRDDVWSVPIFMLPRPLTCMAKYSCSVWSRHTGLSRDDDDKHSAAWDAGHIGMRVVIIYSLIRDTVVAGLATNYVLRG